LTFPQREQDIPAYLNMTSEDGKIYYREDIYVGYKHYQAKGVKPLFPFGFGLSYTSFEYSDLKVSPTAVADGDASAFAVDVSVTVKNTGNVKGSESIQLYVGLPKSGVAHPELQLRSFAKVRNLSPGASETVKLRLDKYAVSFWDTPRSVWRGEKGVYRVVIGSSSVDLKLDDQFTLERPFTWSGL